jgi:hypothetical protein
MLRLLGLVLWQLLNTVKLLLLLKAACNVLVVSVIANTTHTNIDNDNNDQYQQQCIKQ